MQTSTSYPLKKELDLGQDFDQHNQSKVQLTEKARRQSLNPE